MSAELYSGQLSKGVTYFCYFGFYYVLLDINTHTEEPVEAATVLSNNNDDGFFYWSLEY